MPPRRRQPRSGHVGLDAARSWLELVQSSGPFLTAPVVGRVWPQGMPAVSKLDRAQTRTVIGTMLADHGASAQGTVEYILRDVLGWKDCLRVRDEIPQAVSTQIVENGHSISADFAFLAPDDDFLDDSVDTALDEDDPDDTAAAAPTESQTPWRLLGTQIAFGTHPLARIATGQWAASWVERLAALLRARDIPIGIVTDGRWWAVVWAPRGATTGCTVWDADLWSSEPETFEAFVALLTRARFLAVQASDALPALLVESSDAAEEVTDTLGRQVRAAVELLVSTLDRLDDQSAGALLAGVSDDDMYAGVVAVMMRIVFLLFAEERRLLPRDDDRYDVSYSVGHLVEQLRARADTFGEQTLEHRTGAWHRLLALSRAVHGGIHHEDLRLPAYGGGLFDPARFPWLEGTDTTPPPGIDDRTVLQMLRAVQYVTISGETRKLTFRALDVEQIGYVYEGLLELEVRTASSPMIALKMRGSGQGKDKTLRHVAVEAALIAADDPERWTVVEYLGDNDTAAKRTAARRLLQTDVPAQALAGLQAMFGPDEAACLESIAALIRTDYRDRPIVVRRGGRYIGYSSRRAATGAHYTPRSLAETVVKHTLEPLVFRPGPLETLDETTWRLRPSTEISTLRIADIAMGSGAFLVAACRWLADRLVEAWEAEGDGAALRARSSAARQSADSEVEQVTLRARRLVAEHCLYGVDINPLAVEMAKLSLWLVTMDRERPFGFLDDKLVAGDSLLGVRSLEQLEALHIDPVAGRRLREGAFDYTAGWRTELAEAADIRRRITATPVSTIRDVEHKQRLLDQASELSERLHDVADAITGAALVAAGERGRNVDLVFSNLTLAVEVVDWPHRVGGAWSSSHLQGDNPEGKEPRRALHWPLAFPEIFADNEQPGFDAIVGNPPFLGGKKLSGTLGADYLDWLQTWDGSGVRGSADLAARFLLRADLLITSRGQIGYVATNTLVEGDTLSVGLLELEKERRSLVRRANSPHPWPSRSATLEVIELWTTRAVNKTYPVLDGESVPNLSVDLQPYLRTIGRPFSLIENEDVAFIGTYVHGVGFTMSPEEAAVLIAKDGRNAEALLPYVNGQDLNRRADSSASRWVINFAGWSLEESASYPDLIERVRTLVKPERDITNRAHYREFWWRYGERRPGLYRAIADLEEVLAFALTSSTMLPVLIPARQILDQTCVVFALDSTADLAYLSSSIHQAWAIRYGSTLETRLRYGPSVISQTLPRPSLTPTMTALGGALNLERRDLMLGRGWGLTRTYNAVHDPSVSDSPVVRLREIHEQIDLAVLAAYGWSDLDPEVGHHATKIGIRWTVSRDARFELLDRLLEENHRRHTLEVGEIG
jgi:hypothetical protein